MLNDSLGLYCKKIQMMPRETTGVPRQPQQLFWNPSWTEPSQDPKSEGLQGNIGFQWGLHRGYLGITEKKMESYIEVI